MLAKFLRRALSRLRDRPRLRPFDHPHRSVFGLLHHRAKGGLCRSADETHDALLEIYAKRFDLQIELADCLAGLHPPNSWRIRVQPSCDAARREARPEARSQLRTQPYSLCR